MMFGTLGEYIKLDDSDNLKRGGEGGDHRPFIHGIEFDK
jgi:hypothetical protein